MGILDQSLAQDARWAEEHLLDDVEVYELVEVEYPGGVTRLEPAGQPVRTVKGALYEPKRTAEEVAAARLTNRNTYILALPFGENVHAQRQEVRYVSRYGWAMRLDVQGKMDPLAHSLLTRLLVTLKAD